MSKVTEAMNLKPRFYNIKRTHKRCRNYPYQKKKRVSLFSFVIERDKFMRKFVREFTGGGSITEDNCGIIRRRMRISGGHISDLSGEEPYGTKMVVPLLRGIWWRTSVAWPREEDLQSDIPEAVFAFVFVFFFSLPRPRGRQAVPFLFVFSLYLLFKKCFFSYSTNRLYVPSQPDELKSLDQPNTKLWSPIITIP